MKSKSIFLMAVSLGFGLVAAIGITQVLGRSKDTAVVKEEPKLPILIAVQDVDINDELTEEMFTEEEWPARLVPEGVATTFDDLQGMVTTARIGTKGTVLLANLLDKTQRRYKKIPVGFKVIGIKMGADDHLNGLLEAGDLVDIMAIFRGKSGRNGSTSATSRTFLRKITVWSIGSKTKKDVEQTANTKGTTVVGLLVTEVQAERIVLAERIAELKLAMRGKEDADPSELSSGTGASDLLNDGGLRDSEAALAQMIKEPVPVKPTTPEQFTMIVHTGKGPTQYHFDMDAGFVPSKVEGFHGDSQLPQSETGTGQFNDFSDDAADIDSNSLIEELDSEPRS